MKKEGIVYCVLKLYLEIILQRGREEGSQKTEYVRMLYVLKISNVI